MLTDLRVYGTVFYLNEKKGGSALATTSIKIEGSVLIITVTGSLSAEEIIAVKKNNYSAGNVAHVIWNLTNSSLSQISKSGFESIATATKTTLSDEYRQCCKTAYVASDTHDFGLLRMYSAIAEMVGITIDYNVFKTIDEAKNWIAQD
jgi:hypothetical protein